MKKQSVKKYIGLLCCLVLVVAAFLTSIRIRGFSAGAGSGKNQEVSDLETLFSLLDSATQTPQNMTLKTSFAHYKTEGLYGSPTSMRYDATAYFTKNETLVEIDTTYSAPQGNFYAVMQLYERDAERYLRIERVFGSDTQNTLTFPEALLGRWLNLSEIDLSDLWNLHAVAAKKSRETFSVVAHAFQKADDFTQKGKKFTMTPAAFNRFGDQIFMLEGVVIEDEEVYDGAFQVNLKNKKQPTISISLEAEQTLFDERTGLYASLVRVIDSMEYSVCNIGNTAIKMPKKLKTISAEQFHAYVEATK